MFKIGIDNYGLYPLNLGPLGILEWALNHGAEGVAYSGLDHNTRNQFDHKQLYKLKNFAADHGMYLEWGGGQHIPRDMATWEKKDLFNHNRLAAEEARALGTRIIRSCSGGLMRWNPLNPPTSQLLEEMAEALAAQKQMLMDHNVILAIETHFEFTTFELARLMRELDAKPGEWLGICLDTMNLLTMLEDPVSATERILPWVVSTHVKDGGLRVAGSGFQSFTAPIGQGVIDFKSIIPLLNSLNSHNSINLNIEDHGGSFDIPIFDPVFRREFPDLDDGEMEKLVGLSEQTRMKMEAGSLAIMDRKDWQEVCEERITGDLVKLKGIVGENQL